MFHPLFDDAEGTEMAVSPRPRQTQIFNAVYEIISDAGTIRGGLRERAKRVVTGCVVNLSKGGNLLMVTDGCMGRDFQVREVDDPAGSQS